MVITCPSCFARYRLSPDKLQGKGAKITCPKCSHVFVVFADGQQPEGGAATSAAEPAPSEDSGVNTLKGGRDNATTTGAFKAVGLDPGVAGNPGASQPVKVVAPGPRGQRKAVNTGQMDALKREDADASTGAAVSNPATNTGAVAAAAAADAEDPRSAANLDFRSVGIQTWKVKVAIGLIYDFSDIATLKKYLADKKVTPKDQLSHNGKDWMRIEEIGDLDQHFIRTWKEAKKAADSGMVQPPKPKKPPQDALSSGAIPAIGSLGGSHDPAASGSVRTVGGSSPAASPPAARAAKARPSKKDSGEPARNNTPMLAAAAVVLLLAGIYFVTQAGKSGDSPSTVQSTAPAPRKAATTEATPSAIEKQIQKDIEDKLRQAERDAAAGATPEPEETSDPGALPEGAVAIAPKDQRTQVVRAPEPTRPQQTTTTSTSAPRPSPTPAPAPVVTTTASSGDPSAMYLSAGRKKLQSGDFGSAKTMFELATQKSATCGECWAGLSEAYARLGENDKAAAAARKAQDLGTQLNANHP